MVEYCVLQKINSGVQKYETTAHHNNNVNGPFRFGTGVGLRLFDTGFSIRDGKMAGGLL